MVKLAEKGFLSDRRTSVVWLNMVKNFEKRCLWALYLWIRPCMGKLADKVIVSDSRFVTVGTMRMRCMVERVEKSRLWVPYLWIRPCMVNLYGCGAMQCFVAKLVEKGVFECHIFEFGQDFDWTNLLSMLQSWVPYRYIRSKFCAYYWTNLLRKHYYWVPYRYIGSKFCTHCTEQIWDNASFLWPITYM